MLVRRCAAIVLALATLAPAAAHAAATCSFDPATATLTVDVGGVTANLLAVKVSGQIRLNGTQCGTATVGNTDTIVVTGTASSDNVNLTGSFAPGLTPETDGASEIEMSFALGAGTDFVTVNLGSGHNRFTMTASGIDVGDDLDEDITTAGTYALVIDGEGGNDIIDASAYAGTPAGGRTTFYGGPGNDRITGTELSNRLYGEEGDDTLYGLGGPDRLYGGPGNDSMFGGAGPDEFFADATLDGADILRGGLGPDRVNYSLRANGLSLTLDNGLADDGETGEGDNIEVDVENAIGGSGDDVIVGSSRANWLSGAGGNDEVYGGAANDNVNGGEGDDTVFGEGGNDLVSGDEGNDVLTGGAGEDQISGYIGDDIIFNADGFADRVECGSGSDDPEPDPLDTFSACEAI